MALPVALAMLSGCTSSGRPAADVTASTARPPLDASETIDPEIVPLTLEQDRQFGNAKPAPKP